MKLKRVFKWSKGFTLVELLLGLAITAIIGTCIASMFWSAMKLDDKMRRVHNNYMEVLMADQAMSHDLENALNLDFSASYPDAQIFDGQNTEFSFITQTPKGIKHVHYYSGLLGGPTAQSMIGRVVNPSSADAVYTKDTLPIEFLVRQESSLADWLNGTNTSTTTQIVAAGLKKGSFNCQYAPYSKTLHTEGAQAVEYQDTWDKKWLPMAVSCSFVLFDPHKPDGGLMFKRDMYLAPVVNYQHGQ